MKYFDCHAHINTEYFKEDIKKTILKAQKMNVDRMIMPSTNQTNSFKSIDLAKKYDFLYAAIGIHPADGFDIKVCNYLEKINVNDIVAVGEVGIDLYRKTNPPLKIQKEIFIKHINFAKKHNKVLIIHMREAEEIVYEILKKYAPLKFVMHSFTSNLNWANKFIKLGGFISFSGIVTFKNAPIVQNVAKNIPLNKILCETDSPFLTPVPFRGKSNTPGNVKYVVEFIASIRNESKKEIVETIYKNTTKLFLNII